MNADTGARLRALDVFRGATVALMILVNNPGSWAALYPPLAHAPWHGCTPTDLVFPFFLFAVGNALALVMPRVQAAGPAVLWRRVLQRTVLIFAIGLLLNAAPFVRWDAAGELVLRDWGTLRNAFVEAGWGLGHTMFAGRHRVRIDHVLASDALVPRSAQVLGGYPAEHQPVMVEYGWQ